jgi:hypothetical protein
MNVSFSANAELLRATARSAEWSGSSNKLANAGFEMLVPRVEHHRGRGFELLLVFDGLLQRLPRTAEQQIKHRPAITQCQRGQLVRDREHDLIIRDARQQQLRGGREPVSTFRSTALRAVAITARVVNDHAMITRAAFVNMPAQCRRATQRQLGQRALHVWRSRRSMPANKVGRVLFQDVGDSRLL